MAAGERCWEPLFALCLLTKEANSAESTAVKMHLSPKLCKNSFPCELKSLTVQLVRRGGPGPVPAHRGLGSEFAFLLYP